MIELIAVVYSAIALGYILRCRRTLILNAVPLFVAVQLLMFWGTLPLLDRSNPVDRLYLYVLLGTLVLFIYGATLVKLVFPGRVVAARQWWKRTDIYVESGTVFNIACYGLLFLSVALAILYYVLLGYNVFMMSARSVLSGGGLVEDVATLRLQAYAGDRYLAPGYFNQFKNILLPLLTTFVFARGLILNQRRDLLLSVVLAPVCVVVLLGTGQRGAFFYAGVMAMMFLLAGLPRRYSRYVPYVGGALMLLFLATATLFLGRSGRALEDINPIMLVGEVLGRFFQGNQLSGLVAFRYVYGLPIQNGGEWLQSVMGILPGNRGSTLSNEIFAQLYGGRRGTSPPSPWGSAWHNFGLMGVFFLPLILGVLYQLLYFRLTRGPRSAFRMLIYAGVVVVLGSWIGGGPVGLLNKGLGAMILLRVLVLFWVRFVRRFGSPHGAYGRVVGVLPANAQFREA